MAWKPSIEFLLMSRPHHQVSASFNVLFLVSRHQFSYRDITFCCGRLHWMFMMSRLQIFCRDITSLISAPSSAAYAMIPVATCCICFFNFLEVATSKLDCVDLKAASMIPQLLLFLHLSLTAFLSTNCCIFLLSFSIPANDKLVSFFIFLYINYSFLTENQTEKWTKKR